MDHGYIFLTCWYLCCKRESEFVESYQAKKRIIKFKFKLKTVFNLINITYNMHSWLGLLCAWQKVHSSVHRLGNLFSVAVL